MLNIFLNNRRNGNGGRGNEPSGHRHRRLRDEDEEEEIMAGIGNDNDDANDDDDENRPHHRHHNNDNDTRRRNKHKQPTMTIASSSAGAAASDTSRGGGGGKGRQQQRARKIVHSASSASGSTTTAPSTATSSTSLFPKLKTKKMSLQSSNHYSLGRGGRKEGMVHVNAGGGSGGTMTKRSDTNGGRVTKQMTTTTMTTTTTSERTQDALANARIGKTELQHISRNHRRRYLCSLDSGDDGTDDLNEDDVTDNANSMSFPSIGDHDDDDEDDSFSPSSQLHRFHRRPTTRIIRGSDSLKNNHPHAGLTRLVLSTTKQPSPSPPHSGGEKKMLLQRDLRTRCKNNTSHDDTTTTGHNNEEEGIGGNEKHEQQQQQQHNETEKKLNDNICVYKYTEEDQSVEFDAAEIIYGSVSMSTLAEEEDDNNAVEVMERKFSLFYEDEEEEEYYGYGMGGGGCILDLIDVGGRKVVDAVDSSSTREAAGGGGETSAQRRNRQRQEQLQNLGRHGWHRAMPEMTMFDIPPPPPTLASMSGILPTPTDTTNKNRAEASSFSPLDRLSVAHILQNFQPTMDEYSAIHDEYKHLLKEIESLEKDRVQLELLFYGAVEDAEEERKLVATTGCDDGSGGSGSNLRRRRITTNHQRKNATQENGMGDTSNSMLMAYPTFRTSLNRMTRTCQRVDEEILKSPVPVTWLVEDILPLMATDSSDGGIQPFHKNTVSIKNKTKKRQIFHSFSSSNAEDDEPCIEDRLRHFRGDGIALLIADAQSRTSLVDKCCSQLLPKKKKKSRSYGIGSNSFSSTGSSSYSSSYAPSASCSSYASIDPTSLDMLALMKLKSGGDQPSEKGTFDDHDDDVGDVHDPSAAILIDEGGTYLTHCAITGGLGGHATSAVTSKDNSGLRDDDRASVLSSYFLKFDNGEVFHGGGVRNRLPSNLVLRLAREGRDHSTIKYLSTGPLFSSEGGDSGADFGCYNSNNRCYYAEFDDGECWWGTNNDDVLDRIFMAIDVHRVAFGSSSNSGVVDGAGAAAVVAPSDTVVGKSLSFVVIGKDGSVKWKNVPRRLHDILTQQESNNAATGHASLRITSDENDHAIAAAAPCEISLGMDGTYFVRFLDGTVDYVLPNFAADIFDTLEAHGKHIRNVAMHVDTHDCLIRYSS
jgi:hypothetical protein